jgi:hypothetical protein
MLHLTKMAEIKDYLAPRHGWVCFHCGERFMPTEDGVAEAKDHFGADPLSLAACQIKAQEGGLLTALREAEKELERYREGDSEADRHFHHMRAEHERALRSAEQTGYDKAVADITNGKVEPDHARRIMQALQKVIENVR